jgi:hypothetical protein
MMMTIIVLIINDSDGDENGDDDEIVARSGGSVVLKPKGGCSSIQGNVGAGARDITWCQHGAVKKAVRRVCTDAKTSTPPVDVN